MEETEAQKLTHLPKVTPRIKGTQPRPSTFCYWGVGLPGGRNLASRVLTSTSNPLSGIKKKKKS